MKAECGQLLGEGEEYSVLNSKIISSKEFYKYFVPCWDKKFFALTEGYFSSRLQSCSSRFYSVQQKKNGYIAYPFDIFLIIYREFRERELKVEVEQTGLLSKGMKNLLLWKYIGLQFPQVFIKKNAWENLIFSTQSSGIEIKDSYGFLKTDNTVSSSNIIWNPEGLIALAECFENAKENARTDKFISILKCSQDRFYTNIRFQPNVEYHEFSFKAYITQNYAREICTELGVSMPSPERDICGSCNKCRRTVFDIQLTEELYKVTDMEVYIPEEERKNYDIHGIANHLKPFMEQYNIKRKGYTSAGTSLYTVQQLKFLYEKYKEEKSKHRKEEKSKHRKRGLIQEQLLKYIEENPEFPVSSGFLNRVFPEFSQSAIYENLTRMQNCGILDIVGPVKQNTHNFKLKKKETEKVQENSTLNVLEQSQNSERDSKNSTVYQKTYNWVKSYFYSNKNYGFLKRDIEKQLPEEYDKNYLGRILNQLRNEKTIKIIDFSGENRLFPIYQHIDGPSIEKIVIDSEEARIRKLLSLREFGLKYRCRVYRAYITPHEYLLDKVPHFVCYRNTNYFNAYKEEDLLKLFHISEKQPPKSQKTAQAQTIQTNSSNISSTDKWFKKVAPLLKEFEKTPPDTTNKPDQQLKFDFSKLSTDIPISETVNKPKQLELDFSNPSSNTLTVSTSNECSQPEFESGIVGENQGSFNEDKGVTHGSKSKSFSFFQRIFSYFVKKEHPMLPVEETISSSQEETINL